MVYSISQLVQQDYSEINNKHNQEEEVYSDNNKTSNNNLKVDFSVNNNSNSLVDSLDNSNSSLVEGYLVNSRHSQLEEVFSVEELQLDSEEAYLVIKEDNKTPLQAYSINLHQDNLAYSHKLLKIKELEEDSSETNQQEVLYSVVNSNNNQVKHHYLEVNNSNSNPQEDYLDNSNQLEEDFLEQANQLHYLEALNNKPHPLSIANPQQEVIYLEDKLNHLPFSQLKIQLSSQELVVAFSAINKHLSDHKLNNQDNSCKANQELWESLTSLPMLIHMDLQTLYQKRVHLLTLMKS